MWLLLGRGARFVLWLDLLTGCLSSDIGLIAAIDGIPVLVKRPRKRFTPCENQFDIVQGSGVLETHQTPRATQTRLQDLILLENTRLACSLRMGHICSRMSLAWPSSPSELGRLRHACLERVDPLPLYLFRNDHYGERGTSCIPAKYPAAVLNLTEPRLGALNDAMRHAEKSQTSLIQDRLRAGIQVRSLAPGKRVDRGTCGRFVSEIYWTLPLAAVNCASYITRPVDRVACQ